MSRRIVVGISGASGAQYGVRLLQALRSASVSSVPLETHLVLTPAAVLNLHQESGISRHDVEALADVCYAAQDIGAAIASGSFLAEAMIVAPCSMRSLAAIAHGMCDNLLTRAADVMLKERRRLILMPRETPLNLAHLRNMTAVAEMGGIIFPPMPAFYHRPQTVEELIDHTVGRALDLLHVPQSLQPEWRGIRPSARTAG